jgi:PAS domain S-box-containing protein/putative nucleotidyltransferase with HDIG domain
MNNEDRKSQAKTSLRNVRMSDEVLSTLVKSSPLGIMSVDFDGVIRFWNKAAEKITGWREDEVLGQSLKVLSKDAWAEYEAIRLRTLQGEVLISLPLTAVRKDGSTMYISFSSAPLFYADKRPAGIVGVLYDITDKVKLESALKASLEKMSRVVDETVEALASAVETRDLYTASHQRRVAFLACAIAAEMGGLGDGGVKCIRTAAVLHDIGKLHVPFELLNNPGRLKDIEFALIKSHSQAGYDILKGIEFPWPVALIVQQHHEHLDGSGYPAGLKGDNILLEARIIGVADVVEAMSSHRPYRPAKGIRVALEEITKGRGSLYDPKAVDVCLALFGKGFVLPDD